MARLPSAQLGVPTPSLSPRLPEAAPPAQDQQRPQRPGRPGGALQRGRVGGSRSGLWAGSGWRPLRFTLLGDKGQSVSSRCLRSLGQFGLSERPISLGPRAFPPRLVFPTGAAIADLEGGPVPPGPRWSKPGCFTYVVFLSLGFLEIIAILASSPRSAHSVL